MFVSLVLRVSWYAYCVCFCTGQSVMVSLNLTLYSLSVQHFVFFEHLNLYFLMILYVSSQRMTSRNARGGVFVVKRDPTEPQVLVHALHDRVEAVENDGCCRNVGHPRAPGTT